MNSPIPDSDFRIMRQNEELVAAERPRRQCFALELDPLYCDVAMRRWDMATGKSRSWSISASHDYCLNGYATANLCLTKFGGYIMSRKSLPRARIQGNLDGLCGVYAVVNSVRNMSPKRLNSDLEKELFRQLIGTLGEEGRLEDALCNGMTVQPLGRLIDAASSFLQTTQDTLLVRQLAFRRDPKGLQQFWEAIIEHLEEHGPGSVLLGLGGKHDHWTCVGTMSENAITLVDSDGIRRILRKHCTIADVKGARHHVLWPTQTYLLRAEN